MLTKDSVLLWKSYISQPPGGCYQCICGRLPNNTLHAIETTVACISRLCYDQFVGNRLFKQVGVYFVCCESVHVADKAKGL